VVVTLLALVMAIPISIGVAIYISEFAGPFTKEVIKPAIELIASLPSVVIGFFGMVVVAPLLQRLFDIPTGLHILNASLMLAFMSVPTISSISEDAMHAVGLELREASYALGASRLQTVFRVVIPAALSGIATATILGTARAIGETMVVLMVAGGAAAIPESLFDPARPMPAAIAAEMAEAPVKSDHYHALFAIGAVLFVITFCFNMLADHVSHRYRRTKAAT